ncbi:B-cell linker protein isoform X3 [Hypomesus transpacificus]|uniref:B-cell linker protein isoform X3 n=1 Tax=Hypomesus transpacificus TaxID=137520 RepID=UPI001F084FE2|nr:B-cell linker protein isoform X3 [Hypomesus transpacificus]
MNVRKNTLFNRIQSIFYVNHFSLISPRKSWQLPPFKNLSNHDLSSFSLIHQPQLQKMVQDIKKNDGSILDKFKRLKSKPAPKVPARDYPGDQDDHWSDDEFESDTYEDPQEDQDDSYEPPPIHRVFTPNPSNTSFPNEHYLDSCHRRPSPSPRKPTGPQKTSKPLPPKPQQADCDHEDKSESEEDNYIEPTEKPAAQPHIHGRTRAVRNSSSPKPLPEKPDSDVYEVPGFEEDTPTASSRPSGLRAPSQTLLPKASPRLHIRKPQLFPAKVQQPENDDYEVCDRDDDVKPNEEPTRVAPKPLPREPHAAKPSISTKPYLPPRQHEVSTLPMRTTSQTPSTASLPSEFKRPKIPLPQLFNSPKHRVKLPEEKVARGNVSITENGSKDDEGADVLKKPWYASACDRKKAEDALIRSDKDGSFLVRKSSSQDIQQPYTLVVFYNSRVYNIPIRYIQVSQQYALGREKKGEERFSSVSHMIENHQRHSLVLIDSQSNSKDSTKLNYVVKP